MTIGLDSMDQDYYQILNYSRLEQLRIGRVFIKANKSIGEDHNFSFFKLKLQKRKAVIKLFKKAGL